MSERYKLFSEHYLGGKISMSRSRDNIATYETDKQE